MLAPNGIGQIGGFTRVKGCHVVTGIVSGESGGGIVPFEESFRHFTDPGTEVDPAENHLIVFGKISLLVSSEMFDGGAPIHECGVRHGEIDKSVKFDFFLGDQIVGPGDVMGVSSSGFRIAGKVGEARNSIEFGVVEEHAVLSFEPERERDVIGIHPCDKISLSEGESVFRG